MKWTIFYDSEIDLINDMLKAKSADNVMYHERVRGYAYVESFKKYYKIHGELTPKQMTQLKRMAYSIYSNVHNKNIPVSYRVD